MDMMEVIACVVAMAAWLWVILRADRFEREPLKTILYVLLVGGFSSAVAGFLANDIVIALAGIPWPLEEALPVPTAVGFALFIGFNEELCKAVATVLLIRRLRQFDEPFDGVVYGMSVALGFAAVENAIYVAEGGISVLPVRALLSTPLHIGLAALWGAGIARARFGGQERWLRYVGPLYVVAALVHAAYDAAMFVSPEFPVLLLVSLACLVATLFTSKRIVRRLVGQSPFRPASTCSSCAHVNLDGALFCGRCGTSLAFENGQPCSACGGTAPETARFCPRCGGGLAEDGAS